MELIKNLENMGYRFNERLTFEYTKPDGNPPPEAEALLKLTLIQKHRTFTSGLSMPTI